MMRPVGWISRPAWANKKMEFDNKMFEWRHIVIDINELVDLTLCNIIQCDEQCSTQYPLLNTY